MLRTLEHLFGRSSIQKTLVVLLGRVVRLTSRSAPLLAGPVA